MEEGAAPPVEPDRSARLQLVLEEAFALAEDIVEGKIVDDLGARLGDELAEKVARLGSTKNAARGVALTLTAYKLIEPEQDVRSHKADHPGGFSARAFDTRVTVPFLIGHSLPRSVESHWLSQTFSFAGPYLPGTILKTQPKVAGELLIDVINSVNERGPEVAEAVLAGLLVQFIRIRNADRVILTRPKDLPIHKVRELVTAHLTGPYKANAPRLPQLVIYAVYECLVQSIGRYGGAVLEPLERLKSADRKRGTIGDVVIARDGRRIEAVEIKHDQPIALIHVIEAIDKVRAETVTRYYLLSNKGIDPADADQIAQRAAEFLKQNGCEIIVNGVLDSLAYYLRLLPDTTEFLFRYAELLEVDEDTGYEHRIRWNECCEAL
jgi:DNA (cytosine-5)-methyltransferase 1